MRRLVDLLWRLEAFARDRPVVANLVFGLVVSLVVLGFVLVPIVVEPDVAFEFSDVGGALVVAFGAGAMGLAVTILGRSAMRGGHHGSNGDGLRLSEQEWRLLWEERLDVDTRRRIWRAAVFGAQLSERDEAAVAVEFARRRRRVVRNLAVLNTGVLTLLVAMAVLYDPAVNFSFWMLAAGWLVGVVVTPIAAVWVIRNLKRCEERNRRQVTRPGRLAAHHGAKKGF